MGVRGLAGTLDYPSSRLPSCRISQDALTKPYPQIITDEHHPYFTAVRAAFGGFTEHETTASNSFVERQNLTMRMSMRRFARRTNAHSKKFENHVHMVSLYFLHYNWVRIHRTIRCTPAMEAGLADTLHDMVVGGGDRRVRLSMLISIGLLLDIVEVCLLYRYGLASDLVEGGGSVLTWGGGPGREKAAREYLRHRRLSRLGLGCLVVGFALQILGNHLCE